MAFFGRGANKIQSPYNYTDMYKFYMEEIVKEPIYAVTLEQYKQVIDKLFKRISEVVFNGEIFYLPYGLGRYSIVKKKINFNKINFIPIDWELTVKYGKRIYNFNEHSKGFKYRYYWDKRFVILKNKSMYRFIPTRFNKRHLAKLIKSGEQDYIETK